MNVWSRRLAGPRDPLFQAFNASIVEDRFLADAEATASAAYARALARASVLTAAELDLILVGLERVRRRIAFGEDLCRFEDIHSAVELLLTEEIGDAGRKLHTGRSRNEQVVADEKLYLKAEIPKIVAAIGQVRAAAVALAGAHPDAIIPGYTHLQPGQYVLFAHYVLSLLGPLERAQSRLAETLHRLDACPLGSGAIAGSTIPLDRRTLAEDLGFAEPTSNSMDAVSDRTYILDVLYALAVLHLDLGRFAEDFVIFATREFGLIALDDRLATSSSLMPQKKNPDIFELVRASSGAAVGRLIGLMTTLKGLPSTYNKDLQTDKRPLREGIEEAGRVLRVFGAALGFIRPRADGPAAKPDASLLATDLADYLTEKGLPFREAHGVAGAVVAYAESQGKSCDELSLAELQKLYPGFGEDARAVFSVRRSIERKKTSGSTHPDEVRAALNRERE
ncbi:MAG: argininosuccinate lyase [Candidatus Aminicenantes bacterium]|nr:argininosuccinate lyase [Candidatus Aminicenantes bacterium]